MAQRVAAVAAFAGLARVESSSAKVWLTTVHSDSSVDTILKAQSDAAFSVSAYGRTLVNSTVSVREPSPGATLQCETVEGRPTKNCQVVPPPNWQEDMWVNGGGTNYVSLSVDAESKLQRMVGFGAAMPTASAKVLFDLKLKNEPLYDQVMQRMFGDGDESAGMNMMRFTIGTSDFAMHSTTWQDESSGAIQPDADSEMMIEVLLDAKAIRPSLVLTATPWSPPAWMKTRGTVAGISPSNTLLDDMYDVYAEYLVQMAKIMQERGLPVQYMTLQNEPLNGWTSIPAMYFSAQQSAKLAKGVQAKMTVAGLAVKLLAYDHNWDVPSYPKDAIEGGDGAFTGTGWHCYASDGSMGSVQDDLHDTFPDLEQHFTECTGNFGATCNISNGMDGFGWNHEWDMSRLFLGNTAHWGQSGTKWISVTDENCGPTLEPQGSWHGRPLVSIPSWASSMSDIKFNQDFWTIAHMARFVHQGSRRVTTSGDRQGSIVEAFLDEAEGTVTLMALNMDHTNGMRLSLSYGDSVLDTYVPAWATAVFQWDALLRSPLHVWV